MPRPGLSIRAFDPERSSKRLSKLVATSASSQCHPRRLHAGVKCHELQDLSTAEGVFTLSGTNDCACPPLLTCEKAVPTTSPAYSANYNHNFAILRPEDRSQPRLAQWSHLWEESQEGAHRLHANGGQSAGPQCFGTKVAAQNDDCVLSHTPQFQTWDKASMNFHHLADLSCPSVP